MYKLNANTFAELLKLNNLSEAQGLHMFKQYLSNQNYRKEYNERKNKLNTMLRNDPVVQKRFEELKKAGK